MAIQTESWHHFPYARETLWPILSKTDWLNRGAGLPPVDYSIEPTGLGGSIVTAHARFFGMRIQWREHPFEWCEYQSYKVRRSFHNGPFREACMGMDFQEQPDGSCRVRTFSEWIPRNGLGEWFARRILLPKVEKDMNGLIDHVREYLGGAVAEVMPNLAVTPVAARPFASGLNFLARAGHSPHLIALFQEHLQCAPNVEASRMRPLALARRWKFNEYKVLRLFFDATRGGLLELSWELLCPNCRSARHRPLRTLSEITQTAHCEVCQINYDTRLDESVELKFTVHPSIREIPMETYCLAGPGARPHIVSQIELGPNARRSWVVPPLTTPLRLRSPQVKQSVKLEPEEGGNPYLAPVVVCNPLAFEIVNESTGGGDYNIRLINPNPYPVQLVLEHLEWDADILTAARVTNWQEFRDLFAREVISPDEKITVGCQIILFTDLRGSTAMYREIGDAPAYALVRKHFSILEQAIKEGHGTIVKTIGDAVMAVFSDLAEALESVQRMQRDIRKAVAQEGAATRTLALKASLHLGPCLAINANDRLDYFGTTVNFAARMVELSRGGDLMVSDDLLCRPEAQEFIDKLDLRPELHEIQFRGFESAQKVWRLPELAE